MCHVLRVHRSGYYSWVKSPLSSRAIEDNRLQGLIKHYWLASGATYGYRNIYEDLRDAGESCGRDRVLRLMRMLGIRAQRGYKAPRNYYGGNISVIAPNLLNRQFNVERPDQWWVSDMTYVKIHNGWLFLVVVMDLFSRAIVGWSMQQTMTSDSVLNALTMAYWRRKPNNTVMLHSDQGSQYTSRDCQKYLQSLNIVPSMSRKGNCWDNAVAESFFANLKKERIRRKIYKTFEDAKADIFDYIEMFYNPIRRHTHNNRVAPLKHENAVIKTQKYV